jgi:lipopolysaccharide transport system ATP-binding protein
MKIIIDINDIYFWYSKRVNLFHWTKKYILKSISFDVKNGECLGVIGKNGAGKTTLLRLLAGVFEPSSGLIHKPNITCTLLTLQAGFDRKLTGRDNAILSGMLLGISREKMIDSMEAIIEFSELKDVIDDPVETYSTGMRARLGFAVAYHVNADVLLIDEAMGVGDPPFRKKSYKAMREKISSNQTVVLVSHNLKELDAICDRLLWIENGTVQAIGNTKLLLKEYNNYLQYSPKRTSSDFSQPNK